MTHLRLALAALTSALAGACDGPRPTLLPGAWHVVEIRNPADREPIKEAVDTCLTRPMPVDTLGLLALVDASPGDHCKAKDIWGVDHGVEFRLICNMGGDRRGEIEGTVEVPSNDRASVRATIMRTHGYGPVASRLLVRDFTRTAPGCPPSVSKPT